MMYSKKPCTRCLLEQAGEMDMAQLIRERIAVIPPSQRASEQEYSRRLEICSSCESLNKGTCGKCGYYVELRAAKAAEYCPHVNKKW